jgi:DNA repair protein RecO (recombination protein O)
MPDKLNKTKGIVLRTVKYGETSVIVSIFTELFGVQTYLVNGVRTSTRKGSGKANLFQPTAILDLVVYHNETKNLQRIKEFKWGHLYQHIFSDVPKNAVALFMVELLTKCLKQPEPNADLFNFCEDAFIHLDESKGSVMANFPLFFALHLTTFFGFKPTLQKPPLGGLGAGALKESDNLIFDLKEGVFETEVPHHQHFLEGKQAEITNELLKVMQPAELEDIKLNHDFRRQLLHAYETYYSLHIQDFGRMKTLPVLRELLG